MPALAIPVVKLFSIIELPIAAPTIIPCHPLLLCVFTSIFAFTTARFFTVPSNTRPNNPKSVLTRRRGTGSPSGIRGGIV
jgi:hypothetical protein